MIRAASTAWPQLLTPAPGCLPLAAAPRRDERVLHVALYPECDVLQSLPRAFNRIATAYAQIDHVRTPSYALPDAIIAEAARINATIVFMQIQGIGLSELTPDHMARLHANAHPACVVVQWDGDMHFPPRSGYREWFVRLGSLIDASLTAETRYQDEYASLGVVRPGFLEAGADDRIFAPRAPEPGSPSVVFLASNWPVAPPGYVVRRAMVEALTARYGAEFGVYGRGWEGPCAHENIPLLYEATVYSSARAALSISICNDITRYTSDRLLRMLCSGALCLVERFPDCAGLGLVDGENCLLWSTWAELQAHIDAIIERPTNPRWAQLRAAALALGQLHTWDARMLELLAIVDAVRAARG